MDNIYLINIKPAQPNSALLFFPCTYPLTSTLCTLYHNIKPRSSSNQARIPLLFATISSTHHTQKDTMGLQYIRYSTLLHSIPLSAFVGNTWFTSHPNHYECFTIDGFCSVEKSSFYQTHGHTPSLIPAFQPNILAKRKRGRLVYATLSLSFTNHSRNAHFLLPTAPSTLWEISGPPLKVKIFLTDTHKHAGTCTHTDTTHTGLEWVLAAGLFSWNSLCPAPSLHPLPPSPSPPLLLWKGGKRNLWPVLPSLPG